MMASPPSPPSGNSGAAANIIDGRAFHDTLIRVLTTTPTTAVAPHDNNNDAGNAAAATAKRRLDALRQWPTFAKSEECQLPGAADHLMPLLTLAAMSDAPAKVAYYGSVLKPFVQAHFWVGDPDLLAKLPCV